VPLGELLSAIETGKNLRCQERPPKPHENGVVKVSSVSWGFFDRTQSKTLPSSYEPSPRSLIRNRDFLISRANTLELVGACIVVEDAPDNLYLSDKVLRLVLPDELKPWLLKFLSSSIGRARIEAASTGNQLSMRNISQEAIRSLMVPLPGCGEQGRIVARIDSLSAKSRRARDHLDHIPRLVEKYKQSIFAAAFKTQGERRTLGGVTSRITKGSSPKWQGFAYQSDGLLFVRSQNVGWGKLLLDDLSYLPSEFGEKHKNSAICKWDVLLNIVGASIGRTAVATDEIEGANCNQAVALIRLKSPNRTDARYVNLWLQSQEAQAKIVQGSVDVARANFSLSSIGSLALPWPDATVREAVVRRIETAFAWIDRIAAEAASARTLIDHLDAAVLAKAFRNELVPQNPTDEPASALLERIGAQRRFATARPRRAGRRSQLQLGV
jgi:type I restriction enzyme S subunit